MTRPLTAIALALGVAAPAAAEQIEDLAQEVGRLRLQVASLELVLRSREEKIEALGRDVRALAEALSVLREQSAPPVAGPFLSGPPPSSDSVGVAKVAVFLPRVEVDATRRHDVVNLKVRRVEATAIRSAGEVDLATDQTSVDLPLDQNGALYIVEWSTSEGNSYNLVLRDGTSGQAAATVQVKPLQNQGRFILVGYRVE